MNPRSEQLAKVGETRNLLEMLEYLFSEISRRPGAHQQLPWGGMKITLENVSRRLFELEELIQQSGSAASHANGSTSAPQQKQSGQIGAEERAPLSERRFSAAEISDTLAEELPISTTRPASGTVVSASAGLAGRIQMAPLPQKNARKGYSREIPVGAGKSQEAFGGE